VSTGSKLEEVEAADAAKLNSGKVAEGLLNTVVGGVDDKRSTTEGVTTSTHLTLTGTDLLGITGLLNILKSTNGSKDILGSGSLLGRLNGIVKHERNLRNLIDTVTTSHNKGRNSSGSQGGRNSIPLLGYIDLTVPLPPSLGRSKHTSTTTHVTEGTLSRTGGTTTADTGNTSYGTSGTPGRGGDLLSGADGDGVGLTAVFGHVGVYELDNVGTDGSGHDIGEGGFTGFLSGEGEDGYKGTGCHFVC